MISIRQAAAQGISRLRMPMWASTLDHLKIDIVNGKPGPWAHLYCPSNISVNGRDPIDILCIVGINEFHVDPDLEIYEPHIGPTHESQEYKDAQEIWAADDRRLRGES